MKSVQTSFLSKESLLSFVVFLVVLLTYLAFPTRNYYYDGIFFARTIEEAPTLNLSLIHPNHLLYSPFGYLIYRATRLLGFEFRAVHVLQVVSSISSVISANVLFRIALKLFKSRYLAWCLTFLFAFSVTWWKFSTDADAYIISVLFLLICFYLILPHRKPRPLLLVAVFSLAVFFHQLAILFYPVVILGLLWQSDLDARISNAVKFGLGAFITVFGTYVLFFYLASGTMNVARFFRWITSYSPDASFSFNFLSNAKYTLRGHARLFFGGRFSFIRDNHGAWPVVLLALWIALVVVFFVRIIRSIRRWEFRREAFDLDGLAKLCIVWILVYVGFLFFWLPHNTFYRLFYLPAIVLLVGWLVSKVSSQSRKFRLALFVAIMALGNFLFSVLPYSRVQTTPPLALALDMNRVWPSGTVVYFASENTDNNLFRYFNPNTEWRSFVNRQQLEQVAASNQATPIWLETTAIDQILAQPDGAEWLIGHVNRETARELITHAYRIRYYQINR